MNIKIITWIKSISVYSACLSVGHIVGIEEASSGCQIFWIWSYRWLLALKLCPLEEKPMFLFIELSSRITYAIMKNHGKNWTLKIASSFSSPSSLSQFYWSPCHFVFVTISCGFHYYSSVVELKIRHGDTSRRIFIVQDFFSHPNFLFCHINLRIGISWSINNLC